MPNWSRQKQPFVSRFKRITCLKSVFGRLLFTNTNVIHAAHQFYSKRVGKQALIYFPLIVLVTCRKLSPLSYAILLTLFNIDNSASHSWNSPKKKSKPSVQTPYKTNQSRSGNWLLSSVQQARGRLNRYRFVEDKTARQDQAGDDGKQVIRSHYDDDDDWRADSYLSLQHVLI